MLSTHADLRVGQRPLRELDGLPAVDQVEGQGADPHQLRGDLAESALESWVIEPLCGAVNDRWTDAEGTL